MINEREESDFMKVIARPEGKVIVAGTVSLALVLFGLLAVALIQHFGLQTQAERVGNFAANVLGWLMIVGITLGSFPFRDPYLARMSRFLGRLTQ